MLENNFMKTIKEIVFILNKVRHLQFTVFFGQVNNTIVL